MCPYSDLWFDLQQEFAGTSLSLIGSCLYLIDPQFAWNRQPRDLDLVVSRTKDLHQVNDWFISQGCFPRPNEQVSRLVYQFRGIRVDLVLHLPMDLFLARHPWLALRCAQLAGEDTMFFPGALEDFNDRVLRLVDTGEFDREREGWLWRLDKYKSYGFRDLDGASQAWLNGTT